MTIGRSAAWAIVALCSVLVAGCEDPPQPAPRPSATPAPPTAPPPREGCARVGPLAAIDRDRSCVVRGASEGATRAALKQVSISVTVEPPEVVSGAAALVTVTLENTSATEATLFFDARTGAAGPRTDWSRVAGVPRQRDAASAGPRLAFPVTTTDAHDRDVDAVPTLPGADEPPPPAVLGVHLRPRGKLTHVFTWWALRIPAPAPIVKDDAGHRYVPKTTALKLTPGQYTVTVDLPLHGLGREERKVATPVRVLRVPLLDGGVRRRGFR